MKDTLRSLYHQLSAALSLGVVSDTKKWVDQRRREIGVYGARKGPWRQTLRSTAVITSEGAFSPVLEDSESYSVSQVGRDMRDEKFIGSWVQEEYAITLLRNASVYGQDGIVMTSQGNILNEFYHGWSEDISSTLPNSGYGSTLTLNWREYPGRAAVISVGGWDSYYHFLLQSIARICMLSKHAHNIDKYIVPKELSDWHLDILKNVGVDEKELIFLGVGEKVMVRNLYAATLPMVEGSVSRWTIDSIREIAGVEERSGGRRNVYVARGGRRRQVANEEEIIRMVKKMGWRVCNGETMSFQRQIDVIRNANIIVGAHGAGLTNMVFATNAKILEIFPADHIVPNCYDHLAERCGHEYYWLISGQLEPEDHFSISCERLMEALNILSSKDKG